jgi:hypothetical protein
MVSVLPHGIGLLGEAGRVEWRNIAVKGRWSTVGESPARELGSLHPEAIGAAVEETKPSEPPV